MRISTLLMIYLIFVLALAVAKYLVNQQPWSLL
jgi:hypothetical protein